jgi:hypothetical protein
MVLLNPLKDPDMGQAIGSASFKHKANARSGGLFHRVLGEGDT